MSWKIMRQARRGPHNSKYPKLAIRPKGMSTLNYMAAQMMGLDGHSVAYFEFWYDKDTNRAALKVVEDESPHTINARPRHNTRGESYRFSLRLAMQSLGVCQLINSYIVALRNEDGMWVFDLPESDTVV